MSPAKIPEIKIVTTAITEEVRAKADELKLRMQAIYEEGVAAGVPIIMLRVIYPGSKEFFVTVKKDFELFRRGAAELHQDVEKLIGKAETLNREGVFLCRLFDAMIDMCKREESEGHEYDTKH